MMIFDIVTIGSVTRDNFLESDYEIIKWLKAPSGEALILPFGEKLEVEKVYSTIGGNSANASITFARQGFKAACFGKIGNDLSGREIKERLRKEKVRPLFAVSKVKPTAYSVLLLKGGERTILGYHGASDMMTSGDIPWKSLKAKWWYLSLAGESDKFLKPLLLFARKNKIKVAFNPSGHHIRHKRKEILSVLKDGKSHTFAELERKVNSNWETIRNHCKELEIFNIITIEKKTSHERNNKPYWCL